MLWVRAFHLFGLVAWLGGLLFLTNLLAKASVEADSNVKTRIFALARRFYFTAALPGLAITLIMGILLIVDSIQNADPELGSVFKQGWFHGKLLAVIVLLAVDFMVMKAIQKGPGAVPAGRYRVFHIIAATLMLAVMILTKVVGGV